MERVTNRVNFKFDSETSFVDNSTIETILEKLLDIDSKLDEVACRMLAKSIFEEEIKIREGDSVNSKTPRLQNMMSTGTSMKHNSPLMYFMMDAIELRMPDVLNCSITDLLDMDPHVYNIAREAVIRTGKAESEKQEELAALRDTHLKKQEAAQRRLNKRQ